MSFGSAPEFSINKTHKINLFVLHKTFLKAIKQWGIMIFPPSLHQKGTTSKRLSIHHFITIALQYNLIVSMHIKSLFTILAYLKEEK